MQLLSSLLISILILLTAAGLGRACSILWRRKCDVSFERVCVDTALGLGLLSLLFFCLGIIHKLSFPWPYVLIGVVIVLTGKYTKFAAIRDLFSVIRDGIGTKSFESIAIGILLVVLLLAAMIPALAPSSMSDWDSLAYHLSIPKLYIQHGGFYYIPFSSHSNFPFLVEILYVPGLALNNPVAAKLMHFWMGVLLVCAIIMLVKRHFNPKAAPLAAITLAGMPIVLWLATTAYVDLATALYTILSVHLLLNYFDTSDRKYLIGCGLSAGFAASTKMTGLSILPLLVIWLIADRCVVEKRFEWKRSLMLTGIALLACSPWYIKTYIYTGNPVYPFFYSFFGGKDWNAGLAQIYTASQAKFGMGHGLKALLMLPYNLTVNSWAFYDTAGLYVGPIFLIGVPVLLILLWKRSSKLVGLTGFFIGQVIIWFGLTHQSRYLVPAFAVLAVLIAAIVYQDERLRIARGVVTGMSILTAVFGLWTLCPAINSASSVVLSNEFQDQYLSRVLDVYPADQWVNENTSKDAKVALFGDTRGFYLDRDYVWADYGHNAVFSRKFSSVNSFMEYLKSKHITYAIVNYGFGFPKYDSATGTAEWIYKSIEQGRLSQVFPDDNSGHVAVYEVK